MPNCAYCFTISFARHNLLIVDVNLLLHFRLKSLFRDAKKAAEKEASSAATVAVSKPAPQVSIFNYILIKNNFVILSGRNMATNFSQVHIRILKKMAGNLNVFPALIEFLIFDVEHITENFDIGV